MKRNRIIAALAAGTVIAGAAYVWNDRVSAPAVAAIPAPPPAVVVATPEYRPVAEWDTYAARFAATDVVEVSSRVSGHLMDVHFTDGEIVREGQLLFTVDPRPLEAELKRADAAVGEAEARLTLARQQLHRTEVLVARGHVSKARLDQDRAEMQSALASLQAAQARAEEAKLNVGYTAIHAPISGRIDNRYVDVGNLVHGVGDGETVLTTIVALDPIHVVFDVDQGAHLRYLRLDRAGQRSDSRLGSMPVEIALPDSSDFEFVGELDFVANRVDEGTGTIRGRAVVANPDLIFTPGLFARVRLLGRAARPTVLVPNRAVVTEQASKVVFVVTADKRVETRRVETGPLIDGLRVIRSGLRPNEQVIVEGLHRARPGSEVAPMLTTASSGQPAQQLAQAN